MGTYTKFYKNNTYKTTDAGALACEAGRYEGFTGLVEWGYTSGMVKDASFTLEYIGSNSKRMCLYRGNYTGTFDFSHLYGGIVSGRITDSWLFDGEVLDGSSVTSSVYGPAAKIDAGIKLDTSRLDSHLHPLEKHDWEAFNDLDYMADLIFWSRQ